MTKVPSISNGEWQVMKVLWKESPLPASKIIAEIQKEKDCSPRTTKTMLRRLISKEAVSFTVAERNSRIYYYFPIIRKEECIQKINADFLKLYYDNNPVNLIEKLMSHVEITEKQKEEIKKMF